MHILNYNKNTIEEIRGALTIDSSMSTVCTAPLFLCLVYLDVSDVKWIHIQAFNLKWGENNNKLIFREKRKQRTKGNNIIQQIWTYFSITLSIFEQIQNKLCRFDRPTSLSIWVAILRLSSATNPTTKAGEGDGLFVGKNILQIALCLVQRHLPKGMRCFSSILEIDNKYTFQ